MNVVSVQMQVTNLHRLISALTVESLLRADPLLEGIEDGATQQFCEQKTLKTLMNLVMVRIIQMILMRMTGLMM